MIQLEPLSLPTNNGAVSAAAVRDDDYRQRILKSKLFGRQTIYLLSVQNLMELNLFFFLLQWKIMVSIEHLKA